MRQYEMRRMRRYEATRSEEYRIARENFAELINRFFRAVNVHQFSEDYSDMMGLMPRSLRRVISSLSKGRRYGFGNDSGNDLDFSRTERKRIPLFIEIMQVSEDDPLVQAIKLASPELIQDRPQIKDSLDSACL